MQKEEEIKRVAERPHRVVIDSREKLNVTGVKDIDSFNENEIIFITTCGAVTITGQDLHISRLNLEDGQLIVEGKIQSLDYSDHEEQRQSGGFLKKMFK
jgi:sporulation protein YabP